MGNNEDGLAPSWAVAQAQRGQGDANILDIRGNLIDRASLASDLVLYGDDLGGVARSYGLTTEQLRGLMADDPVLQAEINEVEKAVRELGRPQARARDAFCESIPMFAQLMADPNKPLEMRIRIWTLMGKVGGLMEGAPKADKSSVNVSVPREMLDIPDSTLEVIVRSAGRHRAPIIQGN